jgi:hypothetical protein
VDIPSIAVEVHRAAGFDPGGADVMDLVVALLGPRAVRIVDDLEGCDPLYVTAHDGYKILVARSALDAPGRLQYELTIALASWWFRGIVDPGARRHAAQFLAFELMHPKALAPSSVMRSVRRAGDSVPALRVIKSA